jgi:uncharacterized protein (TIGR00369 family)
MNADLGGFRDQDLNHDGRGAARYVGVSMREVGDQAPGDVRLHGSARLVPSIMDESGEGVLAGALLTMCDNVGGFCGGLASLPDGWFVTTNLMMQRTRVATQGETLHFVSSVLRRGRAAVVTDVQATDEAGVVAVATVTSAVLVPAAGVPQWERPAAIDDDGRDPLPRAPFYKWLGFEQSAGVITMEITDAVRNPWGFVHGGVTASLIDAAAMAVSGDGVLLDATVHYVAPSRQGPLVAAGDHLGATSAGDVVRVEVRDTAADRTTAVAIVTVGSALGLA